MNKKRLFQKTEQSKTHQTKQPVRYSKDDGIQGDKTTFRSLQPSIKHFNDTLPNSLPWEQKQAVDELKMSDSC